MSTPANSPDGEPAGAAWLEGMEGSVAATLRGGRRASFDSVQRTLGRHRDVVSNAGSLFGTTAVTSLLGFGFWWLAARLFSVTAVGYASAAVSAMMLLGTIGMLGLGTVLITELAKRPAGAGSMLVASLLASAVASALLGFGFFLLAPSVTTSSAPFAAYAATMVLFALGTALTGATFVLDQALIGLLYGGLQLWRNVIFSVVKLVLLSLAAVLMGTQTGVGILAAWIAGTVASVLLLAVLMWRRGIPVLHAPDWMIMRRLSRVVAAHNWLNIALLAPGYAFPIVATGLVSATAGASFYAAWNILNFLAIVPFHLSTVLHAIGAADVRTLQHKLRFALRLALLVGLVGVPLLVVGAELGLSAFGPTYAEQGTLPLRLLAFTYFAWMLKAYYVGICRIHNRITRAAAVMTAGGLLELGAAVTGALIGGLVGLSIGLLAAMGLVAAFTARTVLGIAMAPEASPPNPMPVPMVEVEGVPR